MRNAKPKTPPLPTTAQPRFVRQPPTATSKPRFVPRRGTFFSASLFPCMDSVFTALGLRRFKGARVIVTMLIGALITAVMILSFRNSRKGTSHFGLPTVPDEPDVDAASHRARSHGLHEDEENNISSLPNTDSLGDESENVSDSDEAAEHKEETDATELAVDHSAKLGSESEKRILGNMSIVVLFHNEYEPLKTALHSWITNQLIDYADEVLFFLNGAASDDTFREEVADFEKIPEHKRRITVSTENLPIGLAITKMVELATSEYVLLLEKDWQLIESAEVTKARLDDSKTLVSSGVADLVRHRHRDNPGVPLHALLMHQGREESILRIQKNLLCYTHHWQPDPTISYPGSGLMTRCGGADSGVSEEDIFCASSMYCQWTNNPGVFRRTWFMDEIGHEYRKQYKLEKDKHGLSSPFLDFEYYTNWRSYAWADKNFTIAVGPGLFRHAETEQKYFNTLWYAHYRLTVDMEEIRKFYLQNETRFKQLGGLHYDPDSPTPPTMYERYPVDFVRKYQWPTVYTGTLEGQRRMINAVYQRYVQRYRTFGKDWEEGEPLPSHARQQVGWREEITNLHHIVERAMLLAPPQQPHEMNITLVTCLLNLDRHALDQDGYQFRRDFKMYLDAMKRWLTHKYKKVVYTTREIAEEIMADASDEVKSSTKFVFTNREELRTKWLGADNYDILQEIRTSEKWRNGAGWLPNSPQAGLKDYNPLVMSKMFMMREVAQLNPWNTTHFLFIDSKHNCMNPALMHEKNDHIIRAHMFNKLLLTTFDYTPADEIHGFEYQKFNEFCNKENSTERHLLRIGRGGIFGGSAFVLEYIAAMYDIALTGSLREGYMGTEENIFSILLYNVKQYIDEFSNNWACPDKLDGDHECPDLKDQGYNCAIFDWALRNATPWENTGSKQETAREHEEENVPEKIG